MISTVPVPVSYDTIFAGMGDTIVLENGVSRVVKSCGTVLVDDGGAVGNYSSNVHGMVSMIADESGKQMFIQFKDFNTEERYDEPFVSKFAYYLSSNKIDFGALKKKKKLPKGSLAVIYDKNYMEYY